MPGNVQPRQPISAPAMTVRAPCALGAVDAENLVRHLKSQANELWKDSCTKSMLALQGDKTHRLRLSQAAEQLMRWADAIEQDYIIHPLLIIRG
ncbi:hypothetical protein [Gilvimarinus japonicus]|uniref:Uncharacterized protein n=1 Tax=Gilvimarinus japonicus TaxID=1796469 RepID=A0ABV7HR45_9GAMM